jgi:hypothetical protein
VGVIGCIVYEAYQAHHAQTQKPVTAPAPSLNSYSLNDATIKYPKDWTYTYSDSWSSYFKPIGHVLNLKPKTDTKNDFIVVAEYRPTLSNYLQEFNASNGELNANPTETPVRINGASGYFITGTDHDGTGKDQFYLISHGGKVVYINTESSSVTDAVLDTLAKSVTFQ